MDEVGQREIQVVGSDIIQSYSKQYATQILNNMFPSCIDGMKKVRRRIIYTQKPDTTFSGLELISNTIRIHPYGDSSIYDTACRMTEPFQSTFPLLVLIGNGGSYGGDRAASARYTKFKLSQFCNDVFINGTNFKTIPMEPSEDLIGREIKYFIPKIPTALLFSNESVGFGYSSRTIPLRFENICDITIDFVMCKDKPNWNYQRLAKLFIPLFPIQVYLRNKADLIEAYSKGDFSHKVETEGVYTIQSNNSVLFRTIAYGISPGAVRTKLTEALRDKNHWLSKTEVSFDALSADVNYIDFKITAKRGTNIFELIENIKGILRVRTPVHVINNFVHNDLMMPLSPPNTINLWYQERYRSIFGAKKHRQQELQLLKMRYDTYLIVCEHVDEVIAIIRNNEVAEVYRQIKERFELSTRQCDILLGTNLQTLMKSKRLELEDKLNKVKDELDRITCSFKDIDKEMCADIRALKKRYRTNETFTSREAKYIGCLLVGDDGILQVSNIAEVVYTGNLFQNVNLKFIPYNSGIKSIKFAKLSTSYNNPAELPTTVNSNGIMIRYRQTMRVFNRTNGRSQCLMDKTVLTSAKSIMNNVSKQPMTIRTDGSITTAPPELFDTRKHAADVLYAFDPAEGISQYVVISVNTAYPNMVRFQRLNLPDDKALFTMDGETAVLAVVPFTEDEIVVNLPEFHKYNIMHITSISRLASTKKLNDVNIRMITKV